MSNEKIKIKTKKSKEKLHKSNLETTRKLKVALPKGHLWESTEELLRLGGITIDNVERRYRPPTNQKDIQFYIVKPRNIPKMVESGMVDVGIVGVDLVMDEGADVNLQMDLKTMPVYLVMASTSNYQEQGKRGQEKEKQENQIKLKVASEYTGIAKTYFEKKGQEVEIFKTYGSTECFVPEFAQVIVDHVQTGRGLKQNNLQVFDMIMKSTTHLISNKNIGQEKQTILAEFGEKLAKGLAQMDLSYPGFLTKEEIINNDF
jgi:ATP phosphoribosyltransferase